MSQLQKLSKFLTQHNRYGKNDRRADIASDTWCDYTLPWTMDIAILNVQSLINTGSRADNCLHIQSLKLWFHVQINKIKSATILQALAGLLQYALISFYCIRNHTLRRHPSAISPTVKIHYYRHQTVTIILPRDLFLRAYDNFQSFTNVIQFILLFPPIFYLFYPFNTPLRYISCRCVHFYVFLIFHRRTSPQMWLLTVDCISRLSGPVGLILRYTTVDIHCRDRRYEWGGGIKLK